MPEGHVIHRLAHRLNTDFRPQELKVTSPQGRFSREAAIVDGTRLEYSEALGKHLFLHFDAASPENIIYIHLGLIGSLRFQEPENLQGQLRLHIATDALAANLRGPQWCRLITEEEYQQARARVGFDPIRADGDLNQLWARVHRSKRSIGSLLMDQKLFAGVGNIYRAEVLFRHQVSPFTPGREIDRTVFDALWEDLVHLMRLGVEEGEINTVRPEHMPESMGRQARDDDHGGEVYVYRRAGLDCYVCGTPVAVKVMEGRNLFWCPTCQN